MSDKDSTLDRLLLLHDEIMEVGGACWIKIEAIRVAPSPRRPHGIKYALCLFSPQNERLVCFDNAHPVDIGSGPAKRQTIVNDHAHRGATVQAYAYVNAEQLLIDFWEAVDAALKQEGIG